MALLSPLRTAGARRPATWVMMVVISVIIAPPIAVSADLERPPDVIIPIKTPRGTVIYAELADTPVKRAQGLMFRQALPADRGMLFTFGDTQAWSFWMKNTKVSLDIIWLDTKKKIVHIERNVPVCTKTDDSCPQYRPNDGAMFVLEVNGGRADALDLQQGKKLDFKLP
jgi:uncharacterized protein